MMSKPYKEIAPISQQDREAIRRKTAYSLPDEPSARGMPPDQIRKHFWSALTGDRQSLFVEIDRVAKETNAAIDALLILIFGTVEVDGEAVRIAELIPTGISDYSLADLLAGFLDGSAQELISSGVGDMSMAEYLALLDQKIEEGGGGGGIAEETDPTVPAWAKQPSKPTYTAAEVGARPDIWMPSAADVGARPVTWTPSYSDVGADKSGAAASAVSGHNTSTEAHSDLRQLINGLAARLNAFANSTDEDLDTAQEFMLYIKANRDLISQITTSKVSVADIVNNLNTNASNKPLSAAQGVALKALIDAITVPTKVSQLENDAKYLTGFTESDPTVPDWAKEKTKPSYNKSEVGLGNVDNVKQYSASNPPPYPVASVNGKTGALTLDAADVGAHPNTWMPSAADVGARPNTWMPTYTDVGAEKSGAAADTVRYTPQTLTEAQKAQARENIGAVAKSGISLGVHSDGLVYVFVDGSPVGDGIELATAGDVIGYVDENNNVILTGALADGTYNIKYEMEDGSTVDIGDLVLDTNVYYSVTNTLTNCSNSNGVTEVIEGGRYHATIIANEGYELSSVVVTMGGVDITETAVVNGNIVNIESVTGDISIVATAELADVAEPTNFFNKDEAPAAYGRLGSDGTNRTDAPNSFATNYIPVQNGDIVEITGCTICGIVVGTNTYFMGCYDSDKTKIFAGQPNASGSYCSVVADPNSANSTVTITNESVRFVRFTCSAKGDSSQLVDVSAIVINIKRNGTYL